MFGRILQLALSQRLFVLLLVALLAGAGTLAFRTLPIDAFPDVSTTQVQVILKAPGMTPEQVDQRITAPVSVEMRGIPRQETLRSVAKYGVTVITVDFEEGTDLYWARQQVSERLAGLRSELPEDVSGGMAPATTPLGEMFMFTIEGGGLSLTERRTLLDWTIRPALRSVDGVADVNALGGKVATYQVSPDAGRMNARGITLAELREALAANNRNDGAGRLVEGEETLLVRTRGQVAGLEELRRIVVARRGGTPVRVADVAEVRIGHLTRYGAVTADGEGEAVQGLVLGLRGANARRVVEGVRERLEEIEPQLPEGVEVDVFYDRGALVERAVDTVADALLEAIVLVLILLLLMLGNIRAALTVALILPMAALGTFLLMRWFDLSANLMSLGGLAIAIGMLVDAAVVVVENVVASLERSGPGRRRLPRLHLIYRSVREMGVPVTSGILIIVIVFLPLLTLQGLEGKLFTPVAVTIVFALLCSLALSLTVIPVLASYLIGRVREHDPWLIRQLHRLHTPLLRWSLRRGGWIAGGAALLMAATVAVFPLIGKTFMPTLQEGTVVVQLAKLPSISLDESLELDTRIQRALIEEVPEVTGAVARTGSDELRMDPMGLNETDMFLETRPRSEWTVDSKAALLERLRGVLNEFSGVSYSFTQPIEMRVSEMLTGVRGDVAVKLFGPDLAVLNRKAGDIADALEGVRGSEDVYYTDNSGLQYVEVAVDRMAAGRLGLSVEALAEALKAQVEGIDVGTVYEGRRRIPVMIRGEGAGRPSLEELAERRLTLPDGQVVPLSNVADIERTEGPVQVNREEGSRMAVVRTNVAGRDLVGFVEEARRAVQAQVELPQGYRVSWSGEFENQQRAAQRLAIVIPVAIGLIFVVLFTTFGSVRQALLVLLNVPFAMIGGVFALLLTGTYLSVPASVGFIALLGIAVLNGVVMVTYFNYLHALGLPMERVVEEGAQRRLRPVMMTASIAALGLVPLLFATGPGSSIQKPLATVVIGGLFTSTLLTLFLLPVLYRRFGQPREVRRHG